MENRQGPKERALRQAREQAKLSVDELRRRLQADKPARRIAGRAAKRAVQRDARPADEARDLEPEEYRAMRERIGSQGHVAKLLGLTRQTLITREAGASRITQEAALALVALGGAKR